MFLFLSFVVAIVSIFLLGDIVTCPNNSSEPNATGVIILLVYSLVCIIKDLKDKDDYLFDDYRPYNHNYNGFNNTFDYNNCSNNYGNNYLQRNVEVFAPDEKKEKKNKERPKVLHYPSNREVREKITELEKDWKWRVKRDVLSVFGVDITESFHKPSYEEEKASVKAVNENARYMPGTYNWAKNEEYNNVAKYVGRCCDIAFDGENFVENEDIK